MAINFNILNPQEAPRQGIIANLPSQAPQESGISSLLGGLTNYFNNRSNPGTGQGILGTALEQGSSPSRFGLGNSLSNLFGASPEAQYSPATGRSQGTPGLGMSPNTQGPGLGSGIGEKGTIWDLAMKQFGAREGDKTLTDYLQKANPGLDPRATPWCAGFVGSVLNASGIKGTGSLAAKSYLKYGQAVDQPSQGDIAVFNDMSGLNRPDHGHVGFVKSIDREKGTVTVLGGNQGNSVSVKTYPMSKIAGFRHPPSGSEVQAFAVKNNIQSPGQLASMTAERAIRPQYASMTQPQVPVYNPTPVPGQVDVPSVPGYENAVRSLDQGHDSYASLQQAPRIMNISPTGDQSIQSSEHPVFQGTGGHNGYYTTPENQIYSGQVGSVPNPNSAPLESPNQQVDPRGILARNVNYQLLNMVPRQA